MHMYSHITFESQTSGDLSNEQRYHQKVKTKKANLSCKMQRNAIPNANLENANREESSLRHSISWLSSSRNMGTISSTPG